MAKNPPSSRLGFVGFSGGYSNVSGRLGLGPRNQAWDQAVRRVGGHLGGIERVPSRFSLFLPSDLRIGPGNDATVSLCRASCAIRCRFVDTSTGFDAPAMFPSNGLMTRRPLPSAGSLGMVPRPPR